jgi:hypothetical protein
MPEKKLGIEDQENMAMNIWTPGFSSELPLADAFAIFGVGSGLFFFG